jgi:uridine kinase
MLAASYDEKRWCATLVWMTEIRTFAQLADEIRRQPADVRLVGIDGCGGAGKTTFAQRLVRHGGADWRVIHTDDFATHDEPLEWWPRLLADVIEPLSRRQAATFRPYDWVHRRPGEAITVAPADVVVIEGVGATRSAWRKRLAAAVWIETESDLRLRRGLDRDGHELAQFWQDWRIAEDRYVAEEQPAAHADLVVAGDPAGVAHEPDEQFVVLSARPRAGEPALRPR